MNTTLLRQTWNLIEATNAGELLESSESELILQLLKRLDALRPLAEQDRASVNNYLHSRISLIKDTAASRLVSA